MGLDGKHRALVIRLAILMLALMAGPAQACRLALVLALDVSSSVDADEDQLQRNGLASALLDPEVQEAFFASPDPVALYVFEWSGRYDQVSLLDDGWMLIERPLDLTAASVMIATSTRSRSDMPTALGYAMGYAATQLTNNPGCLYQKIDVAGDGENNDGFGPQLAYEAFPFADVTVNALVVQTGPTGASGLIPYFQQEVLHGPGAFVEVALGYEDYAQAMRRKLLRELEVQVIGGLLPAQSPG